MTEKSLPNRSLPRPTPSGSRPPLSRSSVAVSLATLAGRRRASGVTIGPRPDPFGRGGHRRQRDPRVGHVHHGLLPAQAVPDEDSVPAGPLRLGREARDDPWSASSSKSGTNSPERVPGNVTRPRRPDSGTGSRTCTSHRFAGTVRRRLDRLADDAPSHLWANDVDRRDGKQRLLERRPVGELVGDLDLVRALGSESRLTNVFLEHSRLAGRGRSALSWLQHAQRLEDRVDLAILDPAPSCRSRSPPLRVTRRGSARAATKSAAN